MSKRFFFIKRHKFFLFIIILLIGYFGFLYVDQGMKIKELREEEARLNEKLNNWQNKVDNVEKKLEKSNSVEFIEKEAREKLKMVKDNEIIYIIQDSESLN